MKNIFQKKRSNTRGARGAAHGNPSPSRPRRPKTTCFHFCGPACLHKAFQGGPNFACIAFLYFWRVLYSPEVFRAILARSGASKRKHFKLKPFYFRRKANRGDFKKICFRPERKWKHFSFKTENGSISAKRWEYFSFAAIYRIEKKENDLISPLSRL